jgi:hypothetical protein
VIPEANWVRREYVLGKPDNYNRVPEAAGLTVEVAQINGFDNKPYESSDKVRTFGNTASQKGWTDCFNRRCNHGGIAFDDVISEAIQGREQHLVRRVLCQGSIPGASGMSRPCYTTYQITVDIKYKEDDQLS